MKYIVSIVFLVFISSFASFAHAQFNEISQAEINIDLVPENPGPNEKVIVFLSSFEINLATANITWKINGQTKKSLEGEKSFSFITGEMNTTTNLDIVIETSDNQTVRKSLEIKPSSVDLIWQSQSYVPPFYKGKSLFSHQNSITFISIPHITVGGKEVGVKDLVYTWTNNGKIIEGASGYGKNTYTITPSIISRPLSIQVSVNSSATETVGYANTIVNPTDPSIILYKKSPLYGIEFQKALRDTEELSDSKEIVLVGIPFFFGNLDASSPDLDYTWSINNRQIDMDKSQNSRVFRQKEGSSGISSISLVVENTNKILQFARTNFNLKFSSINNTN